MDNEENKDQTHEGSMGTDRKGPSGTEDAQLEMTEEQKMKKRIEELRKRDPFVYR